MPITAASCPRFDLDPGERGTFGHFLAGMTFLFCRAREAGETMLVVEHAELARRFNVSRDTIVDWCRKAYEHGNISPRFRSETDPATGERRRVANGYAVALTASCRAMFREQWAKATAEAKGPTTTHITLALSRIAARAIFMRRRLKALLSGSSPYVERTPLEKGEPLDLPLSARVFSTPEPSVRTVKPLWHCHRCETANPSAAPRCYKCRTDRLDPASRAPQATPWTLPPAPQEGF